MTDRIVYKRATMTAGVRLDWFMGSVGDSAILPNKWADSATYEGFGDAPNWRDISPRLGFAYDLFGNGKTALKVGASKYLNAETVNTAGSVNPINTLTSSQALTWTDINGDHTISTPMARCRTRT